MPFTPTGMIVGPRGNTGTTGVGVASTALVAGRLVLTMTNGSTLDAGPATGPDGLRGRDVNFFGTVATVADLPGNLAADDEDTAYLVTADGDLHWWNGTAWENSGQIRGPVGLIGDVGPVGVRGISWTVGNGAPTWPGTPIEGDQYLDATTGQVHVYDDTPSVPPADPLTLSVTEVGASYVVFDVDGDFGGGYGYVIRGVPTNTPLNPNTAMNNGGQINCYVPTPPEYVLQNDISPGEEWTFTLHSAPDDDVTPSAPITLTTAATEHRSYLTQFATGENSIMLAVRTVGALPGDTVQIRVRYASSPGGDPDTYETTPRIAPINGNFLITGLAPDSRYTFDARLDSDGPTGRYLGMDWQMMTQSVGFGAPKNAPVLTLNSVTPDTITVDVAGEVGAKYLVSFVSFADYSPVNNNWRPIGGPVDPGTFVLTADLNKRIQPGTDYYLRAAAYLPNGVTEAESERITATTTTDPTWATLEIASIAANSTVLTIGGAPGADSYTLQRQVSGGSWDNLEYPPFTYTPIQTGLSAGDFTVTGLQPFRYYGFRVLAVLGGVNQHPSATRTVFTMNPQ